MGASLPNMPETLQFLVIDFHAESRFLLVKTLLRKYPGAKIHEADDADGALELIRTTRCDAAIAHRTFDLSGAELVKLLRAVQPEIPVILVSGMDRTTEAQAAGANAFLLYDEWLRLGTVVERVMAEGGAKRAPMAITSGR